MIHRFIYNRLVISDRIKYVYFYILHKQKVYKEYIIYSITMIKTNNINQTIKNNSEYKTLLLPMDINNININYNVRGLIN